MKRLSAVRPSCFRALCLAAAAAWPPAVAAGEDAALVVEVDVDAEVRLDGASSGTAISPREPGRFSVSTGTRHVAVLSRGREARQAERLDVGRKGLVHRVALRETAEAVRRDYRLVPGGSFERGCVQGDDECDEDESPRRTITVRDFWMMRTEVPAGAYLDWARAHGRPVPEAPPHNPDWGDRSRPIVNMTWTDADRFCAAAGSRLPTEAEWEYAARGGHAGRKYAWGDGLPPLVGGKPAANVNDAAARRKVGTAWFHGYDDGYAESAPVGSFPPNDYGLFDLAGNVWEWCSDRYDPRYYGESPQIDPRGVLEGASHVLRGGAWAGRPSSLRLSNRVAFTADAHDFYLGFRCARTPADLVD